MFNKISRNHPTAVAALVKPLVAGLGLVCALSASIAVSAPNDERTGKEVVDGTCGTCHATGANGAPKIGDQAAWSKLASQGLSGLTRIALTGIRKMPPHGGNLKLTDTEIKRAVAYMVNQSGGHWIEPTSKQKLPAKRTGEQIVKVR